MVEATKIKQESDGNAGKTLVIRQTFTQKESAGVVSSLRWYVFLLTCVTFQNRQSFY